MADVATVTFSGSSAETIENAKAFWRSIDPPAKPKSALVVTGIDHRLPTATETLNSRKLDNAYQSARDLKEKDEDDPRLEKHLEDAQKRKDQQQAEYVQQMTSFREEAQQRLFQRKSERLQKEEISHQQFSDPDGDFSWEPSDEDEEAAKEVMAELDKFEDNLKQREAIKPV